MFCMYGYCVLLPLEYSMNSSAETGWECQPLSRDTVLRSFEDRQPQCHLISVMTPAAMVLPEYLNINLPRTLLSLYSSTQTGRENLISIIAFICFVRHLGLFWTTSPLALFKMLTSLVTVAGSVRF